MLERNQLPQVKEERKEAKVKAVDRNEVGEIRQHERENRIKWKFFWLCFCLFGFVLFLKKKSCVMLRGTKWNQRGG